MNQTTLPSFPAQALLQEITATFAALPQVAAVALAGSQAATLYDTASDLDIYIYCRAEVTLDVRAALAQQHDARNPEIGNDDFGAGDEWVDAASRHAIDLIYFGTLWIEEQLDRVLVRHQPALGYTTAFWSTLRRSIPLYDRDGWFAHLHARAQATYPEALRRAIIAKNYPLLRHRQSSYLHQLEKAWQRQDRVSVNHRVAALLASYFDILFALNHALHPGEKRILRYARELCPLCPPHLEEQVEALLLAQAAPWQSTQLFDMMHALLDGLDRLLRQEALI